MQAQGRRVGPRLPAQPGGRVAIPGRAAGPTEGAAWEKQAAAVPSRYYQFKTDLDRPDAEHLAGHMDAVFGSYMAIFSKLPIQAKQPARLNLYLFANQRTYGSFLGWKFGDDGTGSWGKCIRFGQNYWLVGWKGDHSLSEMQSLLQHEGFHQVAGQIFPGLPLWANEGMAELFERGIVVGDRLALGEISKGDYRRLHLAIDQDALIPFDRFFSMSDREWATYVRSGHAQLNYLQAWSLVHFLLYAEDGKYEQGFMRFLVQLNRELGWQKAFVSAFGMPDFRAMEQEWLDYIKKEIPTDYRETIRRLDFLAAGVAKLAEEKIFPGSLEELQDELRKADFKHESDLYGKKGTITATDAAVFSVPGADDDPSRRFLFVDRRNREWKPDSKRRPTGPPTILAVGRMPRTFVATIAKRGRAYQHTLSAVDPLQINGNATSPKSKPNPRPENTSSAKQTAGGTDRPSTISESASKRFRTWHSADGRFSVEARLTGILGNVALLKKRDGKLIKVPCDKLSKEDREFLRKRP